MGKTKKRQLLGRCIVADPEICHGEPTFRFICHPLRISNAYEEKALCRIRLNTLLTLKII